jgi:hypothetical protein
MLPFYLSSNASHYNAYVKRQHNTWNDNLEVGVLTEGFDKFTLFRLNDGAVSILRLQVRVAKTSFFLPRVVGVWFPFIRLLYKWERQIPSWLHCTLPFETVFALLFLTTSAWFLIPDACLGLLERRITANADSDVLQWLCRGNLSFCLMPWLILCHYRRENYIATDTLQWLPLTRMRVNRFPWRSPVARLFPLQLGRSFFFFDDCEWCHSNRSSLVFAVFHPDTAWLGFIVT